MTLGRCGIEFNVSQLLKLAVGAKRVYHVDEDVEGIGESGNLTRVCGDVKLLRTATGILVNAALATTVEGTCSRCLEPMVCELELEVEEEYFPTVDVDTGYKVAVPEDVTAFTIDANHVLSLDEAVRQYTVISQPMQPLCAADCAGLCPECGANLNLAPCECHLQADGGPFAVLGGLLDVDDDLDASNERR
ncbi:MAG: DUF177 domain-containing protein [Dehalococcoidia bacterium]|nr:DUF177 domain-containing protein [Dehalococcoidia bacterium]